MNDLEQRAKENRIILESVRFEDDGTITHLKDAAAIARQLGGVFGVKYDKEMVRSRRKRLIRSLRATPTQDTCPPTSGDFSFGEGMEETNPYADPHDLVTAEFRPGDSCLVLNDLHIPFHDEKALHVALSIGRDVYPTQLIVAGDAINFDGLSTFVNEPNLPSPSKEMKIARPILRTIRGLLPAHSRAEFKLGNHEFRYIKWLWEKGKPLGDLVRPLSAPEALDLGDWVVTGYHQDTDLGNFRVTHGEVARAGAGTTAKAEFEARLTSGISGHTHRAGTYRKSAAGKDYYWYENGCLCLKDAHYVGAKGADWQHAFSILRHDGQQVQVEQIHIVNHRAYYGGRLYTPGS